LDFDAAGRDVAILNDDGFYFESANHGRRPMTRRISVAGTAALLLALATLSPLLGQQQKKSADEASDQKAKASFRRLPNQYGRLGISDEQREKIYAIQTEFGQQIEALRQQIEDLEKSRDEANRAALTEGQRGRLDELLAQARERRANRQRDAAKKKSSDAPDNDSPDSPE
jgi:hypothetical protein